jgi:AcrR family transcriptional regulator
VIGPSAVNDSGSARASSPSPPGDGARGGPVAPADGIGSGRGVAVQSRRSATAVPLARALAPTRTCDSIHTDMANLQRARLITAAEQVVGELGYARLTVSQVINRARVSRRTFYDLFAGREDCFLAVLEQAVELPTRLACGSFAQERSWRTGMRAALEAVLVLMDEEPGLARLCMIDALGGGPRILAFRVEMMRKIAHALDLGRQEPAALREPPAITGEAVAGGVFCVLHNRLCRREELADLLDPLMSMITLPYLGARTASQELSRGDARPARERRHPSSREMDPLHALGVRITYRTVRTLRAIAEHPGASNREIGRHAGIADDGQVSKLLCRLSRLDLIVNNGAGRKGSANSWRLTERGQRLRPKASPCCADGVSR